jgi:acid phosphatase type 7
MEPMRAGGIMSRQGAFQSVASVCVAAMLAATAGCVDATGQSAAAPGRDRMTGHASSHQTARPSPPTIVAAGDISADRLANQRFTARLVRRLSPTRVLTLGDEQYPSGAYSDFRAFYGPTWGRFRSRTIPAPGNHEYETHGASGYLRYFGDRASRRGHTYFSTRIGGWHIVSLNSNIARGPSSPQLRWLRSDLRRNRTDCVLAFWHHPRFTSGTTHGPDPSVSPFWRALHRARVDVVLNGHEHNYERFAKQNPSGRRARHGVREFVVGTGGIGHYPFGAPARNSQIRLANVFGVLEMTLRPHAYDWRFVAVGGRVRDRGHTACN